MTVQELIEKLDTFNLKTPIYLQSSLAGLVDFILQGNASKRIVYICELEHAYTFDFGRYFLENPEITFEVDDIREIFKTVGDLIKDLKTRLQTLKAAIKNDYENADYDIEVNLRTLGSKDDAPDEEVVVISQGQKLKQYKRKRQ